MFAPLLERVQSIPPVTRFFTVLSVIVSFLVASGYISPGDLLFYFPNVMGQGNGRDLTAAFGSVALLYRCFTSFLVPLGVIVGDRLNAVFDIYLFYKFSSSLELFDGKFRRRFPDSLWFALLTGTLIVFLTILVLNVTGPDYLPCHHLMMLACITYVWSRDNKNAQISFLGLFKISAYYLPVFNLALSFLLHGNDQLVNSLVGIWSGYLYQCIASDTIPIYNLFPSSYPGTTSLGTGHRVGTASLATVATGQDPQFADAVFDHGYLPAPRWLYKLSGVPFTKERTTAFTKRPDTNRAAVATGAAPALSLWTGTTEKKFRGKGHRLGD